MAYLSNGMVSIIVVAGGKSPILAECLESVARQKQSLREVIVVDNTGTAALSFHYSHLLGAARWITPGKPLSYCQSLNAAISAGSGEYVLCLNDDVVLQDDYIGEALRGFQAGERIGMVSGRILRFDKNTLDSTGLFLTPFRTARERGYGQKESGRYLKAGYIFGVCGAVAFYRRKMLEAVKAGEEYFDNSFGYFYEDLDIAWRGQRQGWRGYYIPTAIAFHLRGASVREPHGCGKPFARLYLRREFKRNIRRNRYAMILKNESLWPRLLHLPLAAAYDLAVWLFIICSKPAAICAAVARSWRC